MISGQLATVHQLFANVHPLSHPLLKLVSSPDDYVVWHYAARFLGKMEVIGHVTSDH